MNIITIDENKEEPDIVEKTVIVSFVATITVVSTLAFLHKLITMII